MNHAEFYSTLSKSFIANTKRCDHLLQTIQIIRERIEDREERLQLESELYRAVIVFLHAMLEDVLRSIGSRNLVEAAPRDYFKKIPLFASEQDNEERKEKFAIADLFNHKGKTVDVLIQESLDQELHRRSFTDVDHIPTFLRNCGINSEGLREYFEDIGNMIQRRHRIVHNADLVGREPRTPEEITEKTTSLYFASTQIVIATILMRAMQRVNQEGTLAELIRNLEQSVVDFQVLRALQL